MKYGSLPQVNSQFLTLTVLFTHRKPFFMCCTSSLTFARSDASFKVCPFVLYLLYWKEHTEIKHQYEEIGLNHKHPCNALHLKES